MMSLCKSSSYLQDYISTNIGECFIQLHNFLKILNSRQGAFLSYLGSIPIPPDFRRFAPVFGGKPFELPIFLPCTRKQEWKI